MICETTYAKQRNINGRIEWLMENYFTSPMAVPEVFRELQARGTPAAPAGILRALKRLAKLQVVVEVAPCTYLPTKQYLRS